MKLKLLPVLFLVFASCVMRREPSNDEVRATPPESFCPLYRAAMTECRTPRVDGIRQINPACPTFAQSLIHMLPTVGLAYLPGGAHAAREIIDVLHQAHHIHEAGLAENACHRCLDDAFEAYGRQCEEYLASQLTPIGGRCGSISRSVTPTYDASGNREENSPQVNVTSPCGSYTGYDSSACSGQQIQMYCCEGGFVSRLWNGAYCTTFREAQGKICERPVGSTTGIVAGRYGGRSQPCNPNSRR